MDTTQMPYQRRDTPRTNEGRIHVIIGTQEELAGMCIPRNEESDFRAYLARCVERETDEYMKHLFDVMRTEPCNCATLGDGWTQPEDRARFLTGDWDGEGYECDEESGERDWFIACIIGDMG
jgi:hypothetical protein